jgi:membrane protease subunit (stomatin/prohibitin family)
MEKLLKLTNKNEFLKFLDAVSKVNDQGVILDIKDKKISALVSSLDSTLILHTNFEIDNDLETTLNIPDVKKLKHVLDTIEKDEVELIINSNNLEYKGTDVKFKYHLYEEGFITRPNINLDKISKFKYDVEFNLDKINLQRIFKGCGFAHETNKIYFYTEGGKLMAELTDRSRHNTDNFTLSIGEVSFNLEAVPLNLDNLRLLSTIDEKFNVSVNTEFGVVVFDIQNNGIKLKYIISALTQ